MKIQCNQTNKYLGFPGGASDKEPTYQWRRCKRHGFDPWVEKIPWRRAWQPSPGHFSSVHSLSYVWLFVIPWTASRQAYLSVTNSMSLLKLMCSESVFTSGGQTIGASASESVLPINIQDWFPLGLNDLLAVQQTLKSLLQHPSSKASVLRCSALIMVNSPIHTWLLEKTIVLTRCTFVGKVMSLLFNTLRWS